jgi:HK97 family phage portal protein
VPEAKSSRTARLIALEGGGRPRWTPRDYAALAREGYGRNAIVYRTVRFDQGVALPPVLHLTFFNPVDDDYGMRPLEAAAVAVDTHNAAAAWNKTLLDNAARPSGALVYDGADGMMLTDRQHERIKRAFAEQYQGAANAGRPLVLEGGLDWKPMSLTPRDMDFLQAKHAAAREIALVFGVPPMLLAIPDDNTYSN